MDPQCDLGGRLPGERRRQFFKGVLADLAHAIKQGVKVRAFQSKAQGDGLRFVVRMAGEDQPAGLMERIAADADPRLTGIRFSPGQHRIGLERGVDL